MATGSNGSASGGTKLTDDEIARIIALKEDDCPNREIARTIGRAYMTVLRVLHERGYPPRPKGRILTKQQCVVAKELGLQVI